MPTTRTPAEDERDIAARKPLPSGAASSEHYDRAETRSPAARENTLFRDLRGVLKIAKPRAPALRAQLKGIDIEGLKTRADLGNDMPPEPNAFLNAHEIDAVVKYLFATDVGRGASTYEDCVAFWGQDTRQCEPMKK